MNTRRKKIEAIAITAILAISVFAGIMVMASAAQMTEESSISPASNNVTVFNMTIPSSVEHNVSLLNITITQNTALLGSDALTNVSFDNITFYNATAGNGTKIDEITDFSNTNITTGYYHVFPSCLNLTRTATDTGYLGINVSLNTTSMPNSALGKKIRFDVDVGLCYNTTFVNKTQTANVTVIDETSPTISDSTSDVTDTVAKINVSMSDSFPGVNTSSVTIVADNINTSQEYTLVSGGSFVTANITGTYTVNITSGTEDYDVVFYNITTELPEGFYNLSVNVSDLNTTANWKNVTNISNAGYDFWVNMSGDSLQLIPDSTHPFRNTDATVDNDENATVYVYALDKFSNRLLWNETDVNVSAKDLGISSGDGSVTIKGPYNSTTSLSASDFVRPVWNVTISTDASRDNTSCIYFNVSDTEAEDVTLTVRDYNATDETLGYGTGVQTFSAIIGGATVTAESGTILADETTTVNVTLQLTDGSGTNVVREGIPVVWSVDAATEAGVKEVRRTSTTNNTGQAVYEFNASNAGYTVNVTGMEQYSGAGYSDTTSVNTVGGEVYNDTCALYVNGSTADPAVGTYTVNKSTQVAVLVKDKGSNVLEYIPVTFHANDTGAVFDDETMDSDANGWANVSVRLPETVGTTMIYATTGSGNTSAPHNDLNQSINVTTSPDVVYQIGVDPGKSIGLKNVKGTLKTITITLKDQYGNANASDATAMITTDNTALGNMTNSTATYLNNMSVSIVGGTGSFNYTVNTIEEDSAILTVNVTTFNVVDYIAISTSGPKDIQVTVSDKTTNATAGANFTARLVDTSGNALAINNVGMSITVTNSTGVVNMTSVSTNTSGMYEYNLTAEGLYPDTYTVTFANESYSISGSNSTVVAGSPIKLSISADNTTVGLNESINVTVTALDKNDVQAYGYSASDVYIYKEETGTASPLTLTDGNGTKTYNESTATSFTVYAWKSGLTQSDNITLVWTTEEACPWDVDNSGTVDIGDLLQIVDHFGETGTSGWIPEDVKADGVIDIGDLLETVDHFGPCP